LNSGEEQSFINVSPAPQKPATLALQLQSTAVWNLVPCSVAAVDVKSCEAWWIDRWLADFFCHS